MKNFLNIPNNVNKDKQVQEEALRNLEYFTSLYNREVIFCIETFEGKRRVFTPDETVSFNLPMTLDTSHIRDDEKIWSLFKVYKHDILNIHLSASLSPGFTVQLAWPPPSFAFLCQRGRARQDITQQSQSGGFNPAGLRSALCVPASPLVKKG